MTSLKKKTLSAIILVIIFALLFHHHLLINLSTSMPRGIYFEKKRLDFEQGEIVAVCLSQNLREFALQRGYIFKGAYCQGTTPIIKKVIACPGDNVCVTDKEIKVNNAVYRIPKFTKDSQGRRLIPYPNGSYQATGYWLLGSNSQRSWDSRYFGEIKSKDILCALRPIFTW